MQIPNRNLIHQQGPKPARRVQRPEIGPWPQPEVMQVAPLMASLPELSALRPLFVHGRGIAYSPLND